MRNSILIVGLFERSKVLWFHCGILSVLSILLHRMSWLGWFIITGTVPGETVKKSYAELTKRLQGAVRAHVAKGGN